jgi:hypothetical protein
MSLSAGSDPGFGASREGVNRAPPPRRDFDSCLAGRRASLRRRRAEPREQLAAAVDADLLEHRFEMVLDGVARDEEALGDSVSVKSRRECRDDLTLTLRQRIQAAKEFKSLTRSRSAERDGDVPLALTFEGAASIITHRPSAVRISAWASGADRRIRASVAAG